MRVYQNIHTYQTRKLFFTKVGTIKLMEFKIASLVKSFGVFI